MTNAFASVNNKLDEYLDHQSFRDGIAQVEKVHKPLPHLPLSFLDIIGKISPTLVFIGGLVSVWGGFGALSFGLGLSPYWSSWVELFAQTPRIFFVINGVLQLMLGMLLLLSYKPLKVYEKRGWMIMAVVQLLSIVMMVVSLLFSMSELLSTVVSVLIGTYLLFELKPLYFGKVKPA